MYGSKNVERFPCAYLIHKYITSVFRVISFYTFKAGEQIHIGTDFGIIHLHVRIQLPAWYVQRPLP